MSLKFRRRVENFKCQVCATKIAGDGYTNHCPQCLWSKHVDDHPGDRAARCGGLMRPVRTELVHGQIYLMHTCQRCGLTRRNKASRNDNPDALIRLSANPGYPIRLRPDR